MKTTTFYLLVVLALAGCETTTNIQRLNGFESGLKPLNSVEKEIFEKTTFASNAKDSDEDTKWFTNYYYTVDLDKFKADPNVDNLFSAIAPNKERMYFIKQSKTGSFEALGLMKVDNQWRHYLIFPNYQGVFGWLDQLIPQTDDGKYVVINIDGLDYITVKINNKAQLYQPTGRLIQAEMIKKILIDSSESRASSPGKIIVR